MFYMFNELSLSKVNTISDARYVLEMFVKSSIKAKEFGFTEIRLHENSLQNLYSLSLLEGYRIDNWLSDKEVNSDIRDNFKEIITTFPLISSDDISEIELFERSEFYKILEGSSKLAFGLGAAYVYGTLAASLATNPEWSTSSVIIQHYSISRNEGNEKTTDVEVHHFSSDEILEIHRNWLDEQQKESLVKSIDIWNRREEYFENILFGTEIEDQLQKIGLTKRFYQVIDCLRKLDAYAKTWTKEGFSLDELKTYSLMDISGESDCTMKKYSAIRKFRLADGNRVQFELHIKIPDVRIYFLPNLLTHKITVGYIGKHLRTCLYD